MKNVWKKCLIACMASLFLANMASAYDIVDRAKLVDDRFKTLEMSRPYGHDFLIDINGTISEEIMDVQDDADKIGDIDSSDSGAIDEADEIMENYYDKEQVLRANVNFGVPIFDFDAFGVNWEPNLRFGGGLFAMMTPRQESVTMTTVIRDLDEIPADIRDELSTCLSNLGTGDDGDDLLELCQDPNNGDLTQQEAEQIRDTYNVDEIPYIHNIASTEKDAPAVDIYAKAEVKGGLWFDYTKGDHWFGTLGLYGLGRADIKKKANVSLLLGGGGNTDFAENTLINAAMDYKLGYKNSNYSVFGSVEEVKLAEVSSEEDGKPAFGTDPLIRLHAQADYRLWFFKVSPYLGSHARSGYGLGDAYYVGADWGMYVWGDRLGLNLKTQVDKEHFTLGARTKLWFMHADLSAKLPVTSEVDGVEVTSYYSANLRFFF